MHRRAGRFGSMEFVTYNVNSISTRLERLHALLAETNPDVALLQETKVTEFPALGFADLPYRVFDHSGGRWAGVVDTVGGAMLGSALKATRRNAAVAICGLV